MNEQRPCVRCGGLAVHSAACASDERRRLEGALEVEKAMVLKYQTALAKAEAERDEARRTAADLERILLNEGNAESAAVREVAAAIRERNEVRETAALAIATAAQSSESSTMAALEEARAVLRMAHIAMRGVCRLERSDAGEADGWLRVRMAIARIDEVLK